MTKALDFDLGRGSARVENLRDLFNDVGQRAFGILRVEEDVVDGDTLTIGTDVLEVDIIDTDTVQETLGAMTDDQTFVVSDLGVWAIPLTVGDVIEIETEFLLVTEIQVIGTVAESLRVTVVRGWAGSTAATHVTTSTINQSNAIPTDKISVPTDAATLTPAVFTDHLVAIINAGAITPSGPIVGGIDVQPARFISDDQIGKIVAVGRNDNDVILAAKEVGVLTLALTETFGGATNVFDAAAMAAGLDPASLQIMAVTRVPTAAEVTAAELLFACDFTPVFVMVEVRVTATGITKETAAANDTQTWGGATTIVAAAAGMPAMILLENGGTVDWAATDTVHLLTIG